ncbi:uncharacterized protein LOC111446569 isoform X1 [Cucurbita moschata]|uniref:Uncharacterized protein LOC111446569 isoform X1 n=1 Tax=Cucurbita moschata TaxID=3662 RepID=A0A6J1FLR4_CUCMO|nr:uncharacterized protein LOC111446569 isoform X1 [Cucurbita moschata]
MDDPLPTFLPLTLLAQQGVCVCLCVCVSELFDSSWVLSVMNLSGFWVVFLLLQLTSFLPFFPSYINASSASDMAVNHHHVNPNGCSSDMPLNRKLKFQAADEHNKKKGHPSDVNLDDYHPIDPVPSSKTSVKPGPIEHGVPLLPHMPNPPPPAEPGDYA